MQIFSISFNTTIASADLLLSNSLRAPRDDASPQRFSLGLQHAPKSDIKLHLCTTFILMQDPVCAVH